MIKHYKLPFFFFFTLVSSAVFMGCDNEEDLGPLPVVDFTMDRKVGEMGEIINFSNSSTIDNSTTLKYEWDFGDGSTSTSSKPSKQYTATGKFPVTLTAISQDGARSSKTDTIAIGQRYMTGIGIADMRFTKIVDGADAPWDEDGTSADLLILFGRSTSSTWDFENSDEIIADVSEDNLPIGYNFSNSTYLLNDDFFDLFVLDSDGVDAEGNAVSEPMILLQGFAGTDKSSTYYITSAGEFEFGKDPETGDGVLAFINSYVLVFVSFEIRL